MIVTENKKGYGEQMKLEEKAFWLKNANYFNVHTGEMVINASLEIAGGTITEICSAIPDDTDNIIDCSGKYITPGLIDMHVHIVWDGGPAPVRTMLDEGNYVAGFRGLANAQASLKKGVTTVRDVGCPDDVAIHMAHAIQRGIVDACDIVPCGRALQITGGHVPEVGIIADTSDEILKSIRFLKATGAKWIKVMATGGAYGPEEIGPVLYSEEEMRLIVRESHRLNMKVAAHALSKSGIINCIEAGIDTIEHGAVISEEYLRKMKEKNLAYIPTLSVYKELSQSHGVLPDNIIEKAEFVVGNQKKTFKMAMDIGVCIALGTDAGSPGYGPHPSVLKEMLVMEEYGMSKAEIIKSATLNAARILENESIGAIEAGKIANLVVLNANPLEDLKAFDDIAAVYKRGILV
ncbi:MAG: amidohydrolase family protein [Dehalobacterium sp.]